ncbi:MAG: bifunctional glutamate N-acetyltransferase/amino-acid acetyltransferase ArgJ [Pseudomonadota bacterium]
MAKDGKGKGKKAKSGKKSPKKDALAAKGAPKKKELLARIAELEAQATSSGPTVSPLARPLPPLPEIAGLRLAVGKAGVKYKDRTDVMLAVLDAESQVAGVFTTSATRSAAVLDCEAKLKGKRGKSGWAILVNSGNANAFTGAAGFESVSAISKAVSEATKIPASRVLTASTGVIGEPLPHDRITACLTKLGAALAPDELEDAAKAIMTTDTFAKGALRTLEIDGVPVTIAGIAKGSGMIAPDMATVLSYVFTDATISDAALQSMLSDLVKGSFNAITVDGDTSTSDTLIAAATCKADHAPIATARTRAGRAFKAALGEVLQDLALQVVMDGEGATKLIEIRIDGAASAADARKVARSIANSPLVKTAIAGADPNWGRVVMAVGKSGAKADRDRLAIRFGDVRVAENGQMAPDYKEAHGADHMKGDHIVLSVDLGLGTASDVMWTCDLTKRYIEINADYRS